MDAKELIDSMERLTHAGYQSMQHRPAMGMPCDALKVIDYVYGYDPVTGRYGCTGHQSVTLRTWQDVMRFINARS
jgi:hypothetical protein